MTKKILVGFLIVINIAILIGIGFLVYQNVKTQTANPAQTQTTDNSGILDKVAKLVTLDKTHVPSVSAIADATSLQKVNAVNAQVYKDAQNGDYIITTGDTMVIYRDSEDKIVYNGNTPNKILSDTQQKLIDKITTLSKNSKYIAADSSETPQLTNVTDTILAKAATEPFYANVNKTDIIAIFSSSQVIVIYDPTSETIFKAGGYETVIHVINPS